jgi:hypothetical protein
MARKQSIAGKTFQVDDRGTLVCNIESLVMTRMLIQANSGGGKSFTVRRLLEQTHGALQHLVIDPEGEFSSLREKFDYIHASNGDGDCLAHPRSAALLAQKLLKLGVSAILDLYELKAHERVRFVKIFIESLMSAPKELWHPVLVVVDEAHTFAPQNGSAESAEAVIDLASRGRKRGFAAVLATQRIQKLHKDAAADLNNKLIGRTSLDVDMARAADELGFTKTSWPTLKELPAGDFFASGPAFNQRGVSRIHVGKVKTTHPEAGARIAYRAPPPTSAIKALLPQLADLPAEAEQRAKTIAELQAEISVLRKELSKAEKYTTIVQPDQSRPRSEDAATIRELKKGLAAAMKIIVEITTVDPKILEAEDLRAVIDVAAKNIETMLAKKFQSRAREIEQLRKQAEELSTWLKRLLTDDIKVGLTVKRNEPFSAIERPKVAAPAPRRVAPISGDQTKLPKAERAILTVLSQSPNGSSKTRTALLACYSSTGGGFNNALSALRTRGLIEPGADPLRISADGAHALGPVDPLPTGQGLRDWWLAKAGGKAERAVLNAVFEAWPQTISKEDIASQAGYAADGGGFNNALSRLRTMELIHGRGDLKAADTLFDEE